MGLQVIKAGLACYVVPVKDFEHHWGVSEEENISVSYFGREVTREEALTRNRERFVAKWLKDVEEKLDSPSIPELTCDLIS